MRTAPTTLFKITALTLFAIFAAISDHTRIKTTHAIKHKTSGIPPIIKWLTPPKNKLKSLFPQTLLLPEKPFRVIERPRKVTFHVLYFLFTKPAEQRFCKSSLRTAPLLRNDFSALGKR